jgi:hypothetical protein
VIVSQARQLNFGRSCRITLKCDGTYSGTSVTSVPIRVSTVPPQLGQAHAAGCCTVSRGR